MSNLARTTLAGCLVVVTTVSSRSLYACSVEEPPASLTGVPADGAVDVPVDVLPVYDFLLAHLEDIVAQSAQFELTSISGATIALAPRLTHIWHFELVPEVELEPHTTYRLRGRYRQLTFAMDPPRPDIDISISFTTGNGRLIQGPSPPLASMQHYSLEGVQLSSCDVYAEGTCVFFPAGTMVQARFVDIDTLIQNDASFDPLDNGGYLYQRPWITNLSGVDQGHYFDCVELKTRALNGSYSDPVLLCGKDAPRYKLGSAKISCASLGLTVDGQLVAPGPPAVPSDSGVAIDSGVASDPADPAMSAASGSSCAFGKANRSRPFWLSALFASSAAFSRRRRPSLDEVV